MSPGSDSRHLLEGLQERLAARRRELGWTLRQAAGESQISGSVISRIERGVHADPSWRAITALELAYGLTPYRGPATGTLRWHYGDPDSQGEYRFCDDCGAAVWVFKEGLTCTGCDRSSTA